LTADLPASSCDGYEVEGNRMSGLTRRVFITVLGGAALTTLLCKAVFAADPIIFEIISAQSDVDQRTGQPVVIIRLKEQRPFTKLEAEKQVFRTGELRVDGTAILKRVIREPLLSGTLQVSGSIDEMQELQARIGRALETGSRLEFAIVD
jgi:preprotein translocase subunit SecD